MFNPGDVWGDVKWRPAVNVSGLVIPPFALLKVTGMDVTDLTRQVPFKVSRPTVDSVFHCVNGPLEIPVGGEFCVSFEFPNVCRYEGTAPTELTVRGAAAGSFNLTASKEGALVLGVLGLVEGESYGLAVVNMRLNRVYCDGSGLTKYFG